VADAGEVETLHLDIADLDALLVGPRVERALDLQSGLRRRRADQLDDGDAIRQRPPAPVLGVGISCDGLSYKDTRG
jgi:hypothetical protein